MIFIHAVKWSHGIYTYHSSEQRALAADFGGRLKTLLVPATAAAYTFLRDSEDAVSRGETVGDYMFKLRYVVPLRIYLQDLTPSLEQVISQIEDPEAQEAVLVAYRTGLEIKNGHHLR